MNKLTHWDPFRELDELFGRYSPFLQRGRETGAGSLQWAPAADISETDDAYVIKADLPGVKKDDVKIELGDGVLTLSGHRQEEKEEKGENRLRVERFFGSFSRSFGVPDDADVNAISAEQKDGAVKIRLPKLKEKPASRKQIPVK